MYGRERDIFNIVYNVLGGHARTAGKTSQQTYIPSEIPLRKLEWVANHSGSNAVRDTS